MSELERSLLRRLRDRDERAFRELLELHRDRVFNITFRMLGNRAEAEDVAQEVFISVFKTIDHFREESKFSTWLYRVAVNHCKNRIKYLARRHDRDRDELDETSEQANGAVSGSPVRAAQPDRAGAGAKKERGLGCCRRRSATWTTITASSSCCATSRTSRSRRSARSPACRTAR
jgi:RNA polymerase sigma-70 factor, ECF subfamily